MPYSSDPRDWDNYVEAGTQMPASERDWLEADARASQAAYAESQQRRQQAAQLPEETRARREADARGQDRANRLGCVAFIGAGLAVVGLIVWAVVTYGLRLVQHVVQH